MALLGLAPGLSWRRFDAEAGAVVFNPVSADTHWLDEDGLQLLQCWDRLPTPVDREQGIARLLADPAMAALAADASALSDMLGDLVQAGLLVELHP